MEKEDNSSKSEAPPYNLDKIFTSASMIHKISIDMV